ncbi:hypothetical protein BD770DRAFT_425361 [Pilaira anomala]|nr:hypothetical protein BD770DRAFT_425361 [Pilaira anomala]
MGLPSLFFFSLSHLFFFFFFFLSLSSESIKMNTTTTPTFIDNDTHYEANRPKLQWLIILIPVIGAFFIYTFIRIKNKARALRQLDAEEEENTIVPLAVTDTISAPSPIYRRQMFDMRSNERRRTIPEPLIRLSNVGNTVIWQRLQNTTTDPRRTPTPPPVYSVSSPPKYDEVIALENDETSTRT